VALGLVTALFLGCHRTRIASSSGNLSESTASSDTNNWKRLDAKNAAGFSAPPYPAEALRKHLEGTVTLQIVVRSNGAVEDVRVKKSSGYEALDNAALDVVKTKWRFPEGEKRYLLWDCTYRLFTGEDPFGHAGSAGATNTAQNGKPSEN